MSDEVAEPIQRALVIVAHPDDAEFGCAGTVASWTAGGVEVEYIVCTDGEQGSADPTVDPIELRAIRRREQRQACDILGVGKLDFLSRPDGALVADMELRGELVRAIRTFRPDVVVCQSAVRNYGFLGINHPDHLAAGQAAIEAIYPAARNHYAFPELLAEGLQPHSVGEVWITGTDQPNHLVDVSQTLESKLEALRCHRSQHRRDPGEMVKKRLADTGSAQGLAYAEAFRRVISR